MHIIKARISHIVIDKQLDYDKIEYCTYLHLLYWACGDVQRSAEAQEDIYEKFKVD